MTVLQMVVAGRYRLIRSLGNGGMGRVWLARDEVLRRDVAIKEVVLPVGLTDTELEELRQRTLREARAAARLSHPNVVQIYDVVRADDQPWIVMEHVPSRSLHRVIDEEGPLAPERAARIGLSVLAALRAAHNAGVLHRDVKPSNVLISDTGRVVLTDFGLAIFDGGENAVTRPGLVLGSPQYIAPERARDGDSTPESDLWSLGATLYAAVEGRSPFARTTTMATLTALATERPDPMRRAGPLKPVLLGLLRKNVRTRLDIAETERLLRRVADNEARRGLRLPNPRRQPADPTVETAAPNSSRRGRPGRPADKRRADKRPADKRPADQAPADRTPPGDRTADDQVPANRGPAVLLDAGAPNVADASATTRVVPHPATRPPLRQTRAVAPRRLSRRALWIAATMVAAVLATLAGLLPFALLKSHGDRSAARGAATASTWTSSTGRPRSAPVPLTTGPTELDGLALLPGWVWHQDVTGFRIAAPQFWNYSRDDSLVYFREPGGERMLTVGGWKPASPDLVAAWKTEEVDTAHVAGYKRVRIETVTCPFEACAEWEYTYTGTDGAQVKTINRGIRTAAGRTYVIMWRTKIFDWQINQSNYLLILASFHA